MEFSVNFPNAPVNFICTSGQEAMILAEYAKACGKEKARQEALSKAYSVDGLITRLNRSRRTIMKLIHSGELRHKLAGDVRGYVVSEKAVREYLGDM